MDFLQLQGAFFGITGVAVAVNSPLGSPDPRFAGVIIALSSSGEIAVPSEYDPPKAVDPGVLIGVSVSSCLITGGVAEVSIVGIPPSCRDGALRDFNPGVEEAPDADDKPDGGTDLDFLQFDEGVIAREEEIGVDVATNWRDAGVSADEAGVCSAFCGVVIAELCLEEAVWRGAHPFHG